MKNIKEFKVMIYSNMLWNWGDVCISDIFSGNSLGKIGHHKMADVPVKVHILYTYKLDSTLSVLWYFFSIMLSRVPFNLAPLYLRPFSLPRSLILPGHLIISVWMWPEWHSGCLWIGVKREAGWLIFTTGLGKTELRSLGENMVLIKDLLFHSMSMFHL